MAAIPTQRIPQIDIDFAPHGDPFAWVSGGDTYTPANTYVTAIDTPTTFTATVTFYDDGQVPVLFHWDWGDGEQGDGNPAIHTYTQAAPSVEVTLTVTDTLGQGWTYVKPIYLINTDVPLSILDEEPIF